MKKILAAAMAILTAAVMAGCNATADEQLIDDIYEDTSMVMEAEASEAAEKSETEETTSVSDTEPSVEDAVPETEIGSDNEPRLAQQEDMIGAWIIPITDSYNGSILGEGIMVVTENTIKVLFEFDCVDFKYTIKDGKEVLNGDPDTNIYYYGDSGYYTIFEDTLYLNNEGSEPYALYRYEHEPVTLDYFDGANLAMFEKMGVAVIYDGTGTLYYDEDNEIGLSLKEVNEDNVILAIDGEEAEFSYYIIEEDMKRYIYFVNNHTALIILKTIFEE